MRSKTGLKHFETGITSNNHLIKVFASRAPLDTIVEWTVADILLVFWVELVSNKGTAISAAEAVMQDGVLAQCRLKVAGRFGQWR